MFIKRKEFEKYKHEITKILDYVQYNEVNDLFNEIKELNKRVDELVKVNNELKKEIGNLKEQKEKEQENDEYSTKNQILKDIKAIQDYSLKDVQEYYMKG